VKRYGRDEPLWVAIYKCMEAMLGISLYSYLYLKLAKKIGLSYYLLCFLFIKVEEQEGGTGFGQKRVEGEQPTYTHVSKCKKGKIKGENKK
jgi:hypothetical protein